MIKWFSRSIKRYSVLFAVTLIFIMSVSLMQVLYIASSQSYIRADTRRNGLLAAHVCDTLGEENLKALARAGLDFYLSHPDLETELQSEPEKVQESFRGIYENEMYKEAHELAYGQTADLGFDDVRLVVFDYNSKNIFTFFNTGDYGFLENVLYISHNEDLNAETDYEYVDTANEPLFNTTNFGDVYSVARIIIPDNGDHVAVLMLLDSVTLVSSILSQYYIKKFVYSMVIAMIIIALIICFIIDKRLVTPLNKLSLATGDMIKRLYSGEERGRAFENLDIHTGDEIEHLYHSIKSMEEGIYDYMDRLKTVTSEKERISTELKIAEGIQRHMLPSASPDFTDQRCFDLACAMRPAREIGGDFYDFFMLSEDKLAFLIADVSGKGVPAALVMAIGKTLLKNYTMEIGDISRAFAFVNNLMAGSNSDSMFITVYEAILDLRTGELIYANAGHEDPFIMRANGDYVLTKERHGLVLGALEDVNYKIHRLTLEPGDRIFIYTDGVPEANDPSHKLFGLTRLGDTLNNAKSEKPEKVIDAVFQSVHAYAAGEPQFDDITMVCLEFRKYYEDENEA